MKNKPAVDPKDTISQNAMRTTFCVTTTAMAPKPAPKAKIQKTSVPAVIVRSFPRVTEAGRKSPPSVRLQSWFQWFQRFRNGRSRPEEPDRPTARLSTSGGLGHSEE